MARKDAKTRRFIKTFEHVRMP